MAAIVEAILFDMGGTLRRGVKRAFPEKVELCKPILALTGWQADPDAFTHMLDERANAYRKWTRQEMIELDEAGFWCQWMLPELEAEKIRKLAVELHEIWRNADRSYQVFPDARDTLLGLFRAGYHLGLVSNTTSSREAPEVLGSMGVAGCFEAVVLSCKLGIRKPRPEILLEATRRMNVSPETCAYVGNLPDRDVAAARQAGFSATVVLRDPTNKIEMPSDPDLMPDYWVDSLSELLKIFPSHIVKGKEGSGRKVYSVALSTMWAMKNFAEFSDFFLAYPRLGFSGVELNHQVSPGMLDGIDLHAYSINSIHEPCPAVISEVELKNQDLLISSLDEERRREGIHSIKRSIDLAGELGCRNVVVHCGQIQADYSMENKMRVLFEGGGKESDEYRGLFEELNRQRALLSGPQFAAVVKSLKELLAYASSHGVRLGIENRYHVMDIPSPDEMGEILDLADSERLGFIYDVGHAQTLDCLGFYPHEEWLKRFSARMIGIHIHDVKGIQDHLAPGRGEVDFNMISGYLPDDAFRTLEVTRSNTPEQIKDGIQLLLDAGCVKELK